MIAEETAMVVLRVAAEVEFRVSNAKIGINKQSE